jgi:hypothetical protein
MAKGLKVEQIQRELMLRKLEEVELRGIQNSARINVLTAIRNKQSAEQDRLVFDVIKYAENKFNISDKSIFLNILLVPLIAFFFEGLYLATNFYLFSVTSLLFKIYFWVFFIVLIFSLFAVESIRKKETDEILEKIYERR